MPMSEPAAASRRVSARSSADGSGSPEGWLWKRTSAAARETTASWKTSRGWTRLAVRQPTEMTASRFAGGGARRARAGRTSRPAARRSAAAGSGRPPRATGARRGRRRAVATRAAHRARAPPARARPWPGPRPRTRSSSGSERAARAWSPSPSRPSATSSAEAPRGAGAQRRAASSSRLERAPAPEAGQPLARTLVRRQVEHRRPGRASGSVPGRAWRTSLPPASPLLCRRNTQC